MLQTYRKILNHSLDGLIVLDDDGVVLYANPAAERLFTHTADRLVGQVFGYPIIAQESSEIEIPHGDQPRYVEMRSASIPWEGQADAMVVSLRDITALRTLERDLRRANLLNIAILNSLHASIAVLDDSGEIIQVNELWTQFARDNGDAELVTTGVGVNYFDVCRASDDPVSQQALRGMLDVLHGQAESFEMEYPCHAPEEKRWFLMRVRPLAAEELRGLVVSHINVTRYRAHTMEQVDRDHHAAQRTQQQLEFDHYELLSYPTLKPIIQPSLSAQKLDQYAREYGDLLEQALEQRTYKIDRDVAGQSERLAEKLGESGAHPRDVVRLHLKALQARQKGETKQRFQAYVEEARLLLVEVMGYLVSYYRKRVVLDDDPAR